MVGAAGSRKYRPKTDAASAIAAAVQQASSQQAELFARLAEQQDRRAALSEKARAAEAERQRAHEATERAKDRQAQLDMLGLLLPALAGAS